MTLNAKLNPSTAHDGQPYYKPQVVDYGSLVELTAANGLVEAEDGIGKVINTDGSNGFIP